MITIDLLGCEDILVSVTDDKSFCEKDAETQKEPTPGSLPELALVIVPIETT